MITPTPVIATLLVGRYSAAAASGPLMEIPTALPLRRVGDTLAFDFLTLPGIAYVVETSSDLQHWTTANDATGQTATSLQMSYPDSSPGTTRFYRARAGP